MNFIVVVILLIKLTAIQSFVRIKEAQIHGYTKTVLGKKINVYLGIPFAEPPIGKLRFEKPRPVKLTGRIDATNWPKPCWQSKSEHILNLANKNYSEDCLYLNIWAPKSKRLKPVLAWIHGGGLIHDSSNDLSYEGDVLAAEGDVVVVSMNYRLDVFGLLFADNEQIPGNVAFYDQLLVFKWIQQNIKYFCGDPKRVTIVGQSAGAILVSGHFLSPESRDYFNNAIVLSGSILSHGKTVNKTEAISVSLKVAKKVGCADKSTTEFNQKIIYCLKNLPPEKFFKKSHTNFFAYRVYGTDFLPKKPLTMLKSGDFKTNSQLLIGSVENEGVLRNDLEKQIDKSGYSKEDALKIINSQLKRYDPSEIYKFYISTIPDGHEDALKKATTILIGDEKPSCSTIDFGQLVFENDNKSRVFEYYYTYQHNLKLLEELKFQYIDMCKPFQGACHGIDLVSLFGWPLKRPDLFSKREKQLSKLMIRTVASFSRIGRPDDVKGVEWPKFYLNNGHVARPYYY